MTGPTDLTEGVGNGGGFNTPWALNPFGGGSLTTQTVTLNNAGSYKFSFWYREFIPLATSNLVATVGGQTAFSGNVNSNIYQQSVSTLSLPAGPIVIAFSSNDANELNIDDVSLILASISGILPTNTPINPSNVASAIDAFTNGGGTLPSGFQSLSNLTPSQLVAALSQLSGEAATVAQQGAFQLTNQFIGVMLDPFLYGHGAIGGGSGALGFARESETLPDEVARAYAKVVKAPPRATPAFEQRWSVWGAGYGGYNKTDGDAAVTGSHDLTARAFGFATGVDYRFAPGTVVGVALAGGGTRWDLAEGLGGGRSDAFQAGLYGAHRSGPWYVAGALAFTNHWMSTDRIAAFNDHLTADFNAQSFGGRIEGGYRFASVIGGITPYGAVQAQGFHTPAYSEVDVTNGGFGLSYNSRTGTDTRTELGARFDHAAVVGPDAVLTLRGRLAWAHDWITNPSLTPVFQALPGSSFIVNGAAPAENSALVSAGAELRLASGVSLLGKFDGEFANNSRTYAGTATLRYTW